MSISNDTTLWKLAADSRRRIRIAGSQLENKKRFNAELIPTASSTSSFFVQPQDPTLVAEDIYVDPDALSEDFVIEAPNISYLYDRTNVTWSQHSNKTEERAGAGGSTITTNSDITTNVNVDTTTSTIIYKTSSIIPYMRARRIYFSGSGLKPNAKLFATFDNENITGLCRQISGAPNLVPGDLRASQNGYIVGYFDLPAGKFKTGKRVFKLTDSIDPIIPESTSAQSIYNAFGYRTEITTTNTINTVTTIQDSIDRTRTVQYYRDPVAQSFYADTVQSSKGVFIKSIDLYFLEVDPDDEVMVQIRGMTNGYPNTDLLYDYAWTKLPGSKIKTSVNGSVSTNFSFHTPLFLPSNDEYCFVVMCNTTKTQIWCSELGQKAYLPTDFVDPTGQIISKQPYLGTMFISQNSRTWNAEQTKDLKFRINRCKFKTNSSSKIAGSVKLVNSAAKNLYSNPYCKILQPDSIVLTAGSDIATLYIDGHGWKSSDSFILYLDENIRNLGTIFGVPTANLHEVTCVISEVGQGYVKFPIKDNAAATSSGSIGGTKSWISGWVNAYTSAQLLSSDVVIDDTSLSYKFQGKTQAGEVLDNTVYDLGPDSIIEFKNMYATRSDNDGGATIDCELSSEFDTISPIINMNSIGLETHLNVVNQNDYYVGSTTTVDINRSPAIYLQKPVTLINPANELKIFFESILPGSSELSVYVQVGTGQIKSDAVWTKVTPVGGTLLKSDNANEYMTQQYSFMTTPVSQWNVFRVMIVMRASPVNVPKIKNYRAIALMTAT